MMLLSLDYYVMISCHYEINYFLYREQAKLHALKQRHEKLKEHRRVQDMSEIVEKSKTHNGSFHGNNTPLHSPHSK